MASTGLIIWALAALSFVAGGILLAQSIAGLFNTEARIWPPERGANGPAQMRQFRWKFRAFLYPLVLASALAFMTSTRPPTLWIGVALVGLGFGLAVWATLQMGWKNAFGSDDGLATSGVFGVSRHPVYVFTWIGLLGWVLCIWHPAIWIAVAMWALLYVTAIPQEEHWMAQKYPDDWEKYCERTPVFLSWRSLAR